MAPTRAGHRTQGRDPGSAGVGRISRLFRDVLEAEKLRTGTEELRVAPVSAADLVTAAVDRSGPRAATRGVELEHCVDDVVPRCDKERVLKVLLHLIENALRASPGGALVVVEAVRRDERSVVFSVSDRGSGIDPREWPFLFQEAAAWRDPVRKGDGLGLSMCRAIVEAHGGRIWCESRLGQGTTFRFSLPLSSPSPSPSPSPRQPPSRSAAARP